MLRFATCPTAHSTPGTAPAWPGYKCTNNQWLRLRTDSVSAPLHLDIRHWRPETPCLAIARSYQDQLDERDLRMNFQTKAFCLLAAFLFISVSGCRAPETQYSWKQGNTGVVAMEKADEAFCYFTRIAGSFRGPGELVQIFPSQSPKSTWWFIGGASAQGVSANMECSWFSSYEFAAPTVAYVGWISDSVCETQPYYDTEQVCRRYERGPSIPACMRYNSNGGCEQMGEIPGQEMCVAWGTEQVLRWRQVCHHGPPMPVQSDPAVCYLAGVNTNLDGPEYSLNVSRPQQGTSQWTVNAGGQSSMSANVSSVCLKFADQAIANAVISQTYRWVQGQPPTAMIPANKGVCFITSVGGNFRGALEAVEIQRPDSSASDSPLLLTGSSQQDGVFAEAICLRYTSTP